MCRYLLILLVLLSSVGSSSAMTEEENKIVRESVLEICRGGSLKGNDSSILVSGEGKVTTVLLKKLVDVGVSGEAKFSKAEWDGIKPLISESFDSQAYVDCVMKLTPMFLDKYSSSTTSYPESSNITGKWLYQDKAHYWVVRPGPSGEFAIELYTHEDQKVGEGTATVAGNIVSFSLKAGNHFIGDTLFIMPIEMNGRLEHTGNQLSGETDLLTLESIGNPSSIAKFKLFRAQ